MKIQKYKISQLGIAVHLPLAPLILSVPSTLFVATCLDALSLTIGTKMAVDGMGVGVDLLLKGLEVHVAWIANDGAQDRMGEGKGRRRLGSRGSTYG